LKINIAITIVYSKLLILRKGNKPEENNRDENGEYNTAPEGYRQYLVTSYMAY
jgi:hypothetical protein